MKKLLLSAITFITSVALVTAQNGGTLDSTFGVNGFANSGQHTLPGIRTGAVIVQADNSIVNVQCVGTIDTTYVAVSRTLPNGNPDNNFGTGGVVVTTAPINEVPECVALQSDGKILVGGSALFSGTQAASLIRFNTDGSVDSGFAVNGIFKSIFPLTSSSGFSAITVLGNGEILCAGNVQKNPNILTGFVMVQSNGTLDSTFGTNGRVLGDTMEVNCMAIQGDGKIVVGGGKSNMAIARYQANGTPDANFGSGGIVHTNYAPSTYSYAFGIGVLASGDIIAAGSLFSTNQLVLKYMAMQVDGSGNINTQYGDNGAAVDSTPTVFINQPSAATILADGRVIIAGSIAVDSVDYDRFGMVRFNANGTVDQSFGTGAVVVATQSGKAYCDAVTTQADGKILLGGGISFGTDSFTMGLARFVPGSGVNGIADVTWNKPALIVYPNPANNQINFGLVNAGAYTLSIYNTLGEEVLTKTVSAAQNQNVTVDVNALAAGVYQIVAAGKAGRQYGAFVKQ